MTAVEAAVEAAGGILGMAEDAAALLVVAGAVVMLFAAGGWQFTGLRGLIKAKSLRHGKRIAYSLCAIVFGIAFCLYFTPRLVDDANWALPGAAVGVLGIAGGAAGLTWSGSARMRRWTWGAVAAAVAVMLAVAVAGPVVAAIGQAARDAGDGLGRAGTATARALPWALVGIGAVALLGALMYWLVDGPTNREQRYNRAAIFLFAAAAILVALMLTGVVSPSDLVGAEGSRR